jgi:hypothetical protein
MTLYYVLLPCANEECLNSTSQSAHGLKGKMKENPIKNTQLSVINT